MDTKLLRFITRRSLILILLCLVYVGLWVTSYVYTTSISIPISSNKDIKLTSYWGYVIVGLYTQPVPISTSFNIECYRPEERFKVLLEVASWHDSFRYTFADALRNRKIGYEESSLEYEGSNLEYQGYIYTSYTLTITYWIIAIVVLGIVLIVYIIKRKMRKPTLNSR